MSKTVVSKRYASALFEIAKETKMLDQFEDDLKTVKEVFKQNPKLMVLLQHPKLDMTKKKELVKEGFGTLTAPVLNTFYLLVERHRTESIPEVADEFAKLANEARGTEEAVVYSVRLLSETELSELSAAFAKKIGKTSLRLKNVIDQTLIGGVKLKIGNRIFDGSVSGKLARIEKQLVTK
ncbi:F0F1 ATP synthase subunit delta [Bacillus sp. FJAT-42376]|uniref:F0F1 ATP synthase subunit delta n=1 Tax=Bacillus sp. FJAT-42376 TaxID=2014076 RepID=UPI000F4FC8BC|nr:F0F1 ATP synthase subunit delta [Bacillus sp. FJAT-42376]AZB40901.1 F0F1 ATP synthase subunit delta [Bacillus sp. FJAT-42376]